MTFVKKMEIILQNFVDENGFDVGVAVEPYNEWMYCPDTEEVVVSFHWEEDLDALFKEQCVKWGLEWNCPNFLLSFFHECFHHLTKEFVSEFDWNMPVYYTTLNWIMKDEITEQDYINYFSTYREKIATCNAIEYINHNKDLVLELWEQLNNLAKEYYYGR